MNNKGAPANQQMKQRKEANERNQFNEIELMNGMAPFALWNELVMAGGPALSAQQLHSNSIN